MTREQRKQLRRWALYITALSVICLLLIGAVVS